MMKNLRGRAALRGEHLEPECYLAKTTTHEYGMKDNRVFCYGLYDKHDADMNLMDMCRNCSAHVDNAKPLR